jgi:hypothetical protein
MIRILSFLLTLSVFIVTIGWFFNNNGWIKIIWLGYEVKIDILTFLIALALALLILFIIYRFFVTIASLILRISGLFKTNELKKRDKEIKKYHEIVEYFTKYLQSLNLEDFDKAKSWQKKIYNVLKDNLIKNTLNEHAKKFQGLIKLRAKNNKNQNNLLNANSNKVAQRKSILANLVQYFKSYFSKKTSKINQDKQ